MRKASVHAGCQSTRAPSLGILTVHPSNHAHRKGGLWLPVVIGHERQVLDSRDTSRILEACLAGALLLMGLQYLGLFYFRRKERASLWFAVACFYLAIRLVITEERVFLVAFPDVPFVFTGAPCGAGRRQPA